LRLSAVVAALVGFGGTLAIIVAAARAVGADDGQTVSWVTALCLAMVATSAFLSLRHRIPAITAWLTPGAALIAATGGAITLPAATRAVLAGVMWPR
jgi:benzoate membrane transport protein